MINFQSLTGLVLEARKFGGIERVYVKRLCMAVLKGIVNEDFVDLTQETGLTIWRRWPKPRPRALGSTPATSPDDKYCAEIFNRHFRRTASAVSSMSAAMTSSDTVRIVSEHARAANYPLRCIHIPKTIDNDLMLNDHTPGFPSAARFVAQAFAGANLDNRSLPGIYLAVVMGRHAGFLTAASALAAKFPDDGPHLVYVPERAFDQTRFLSDVKKVMDKYGRCVIAVSEGIADDKHVPIATRLMAHVEKDAHTQMSNWPAGRWRISLTRLIKDSLGYKRVRGDTFGYVQRSFLGCVSDVDQREAREVGEKAVQFAVWGDRDGSVTIHRAGDYAVDYKLSRLEEIAGKTKVMADGFIAADGNAMSPTPSALHSEAAARQRHAAGRCLRTPFLRRNPKALTDLSRISGVVAFPRPRASSDAHGGPGYSERARPKAGSKAWRRGSLPLSKLWKMPRRQPSIPASPVASSVPPGRARKAMAAG